jgi:small subunit ribosomal protein S18
MAFKRGDKNGKNKSRGKSKGKGKGKNNRRDNQRDDDFQNRASKFKRKRRVCVFCADKIVADYKDLGLIRRFVSDRGKILPRRTTGSCAKHQRFIAKEIKRARELAMLPYQLD